MGQGRLREIREAHGLTRRFVATQLGLKSTETFRKKEAGVVRFSDREKALLVSLYGMSFEDFNAIWYDGKLPYKADIFSA